MRQQLRNFLTKLLSYLPTKLPVGKTAYNLWLKSVTDLAGPIADVESMEWVISNEVMRLNSSKDSVPKSVFVKILRKYAANQLAASHVMDLKSRQEARSAAQSPPAQPEVTTTGTSDGTKTNVSGTPN
jgi:hypothetical protein